MKDLINIIEDLIKDNEYISEFIDKNIEFIKADELDKLDQETAQFYLFMNKYTDRNSKFKELMDLYGYSTVWEIKTSDEDNNKKLQSLFKNFDSSVRESQKKLTLYGQMISGELNMINKIKYFKSTGKIDFKL